MHINIEVQGSTALICHKFSDQSSEEASAGARSSAASADRGTPREQAAASLYIGLDGEPMIPQPNLLRCIVDGGTFFKAGRTQITSASKSLLYSCVDIVGAEIKIHHDEPWRVDTRAVVIPATRGRVLRHRPMFDDWRLSFVVELDTSVIAAKLFREIVDAAGKKVGLGDFRPARKGPYGRFVVTRWEQETAALAA